MRLVVIGNGMAGAHLVSEFRRRDPDSPVTVFGAESRLPYNRVLLPGVLAGTTDPRQIGMTDARWYADHGVDARFGAEVTRIDRERRNVIAADGTVAAYDTLVLATGSVPLIPPLPGLRPLASGVVAFRTIDDCDRISRLADTAKRAVVIGGGLLGLEAARGLAGRGLDVTVLHLAGHLMERQLDPEAAGVLQRTLAGLGVEVRVGARLAGVETEGAARRARGARLADGTVLDADLIVLACGIKPAADLARAAGLTVDHGIVVDDTLTCADDPDVRAIGECAQHRGTVYGLVAPAWEQAAVLADLLSGTGPAARYTGSRHITRLKAASIELAAMGDTSLDDDDAEIVRFADPVRGTYKKLVVQDDRLVGAILLGETSTAGTLTQLYDRSASLPLDRLPLLFGGLDRAGPAVADDAAPVCHCNAVSKRAIRDCWERGARTVADIAAGTRATTGCGGCVADVAGIVRELGEPDRGERLVARR